MSKLIPEREKALLAEIDALRDKLDVAVTALRAITSSEYCTEFGDEPCELAEAALAKIKGDE